MTDAIAARHGVKRPDWRGIRTGLAQITTGKRPADDPARVLQRTAEQIDAPLLPHRLDEARAVIRAAQSAIHAGRIP